MKTSLVIFDVDGVLMDTFPVTRDIYDSLADEFGLKKSENHEFYDDFFELDWRISLKKFGIVTDDDRAKAEKVFSRLIIEHDNMISPFRGIPEVLTTLKQDYTLAIVSNNQKVNFIQRLEKHNIMNHFDLILGLEDGEFKPSPDMLIKCMKRLNKSPEETVFIGDMDGDIIAGKRAKIKKTIAVTYGFHKIHRLKEADEIIHSPSEIIEAIK
ncbi:MAG: HAD family hydrolase [Nanoarchaeota archaeon]|nr:HAD family hydrolase [Nanoarchaeota archaeon]